MATIGHARVSTRDQHLDMQEEALKKAGCNPIFTEKASGVRERPVLQQCMTYLRKGDTLVVYKFDRIGRSLKDLVSIFATLEKKGVMLRSIEDKVDPSTPSGKLMIHIFASLAEFERDLIIERTQAGRAAAKAKGTRMGRRKGSGINKDKVDACANLYKSGMDVKAIMQQLNIRSKSTFYIYLRMKGLGPLRRADIIKDSRNAIDSEK
jgi:DNA invertase Pin-like site-specific DNA recombinase